MNPVRITYRHVPSSEALNQYIQGEANKLEEFYRRIVDCHVVVDRPNRHFQGGQPFRVRVELLVPRERIVGAVEPTTEKKHEDVYLAVSEAFQAARRELQDYVRRRRGHVKAPSRSPARGRVVKAAESGLGFAATEGSEDEEG